MQRKLGVCLMFKENDIVYFVFNGDWNSGAFNSLFCLPTMYYCFMPAKIICKSQYESRANTYLMYDNNFSYSWTIPTQCLIKEFTLQRFIVEQREWYKNTGKRLTRNQMKAIASTLKAGSSNGRTDRS